MKKVLLSVLFIGWLFLLPALGCDVTTYIGSEKILETDPIDLEGELNPGPGLRSGGDPVTCELQGNIIKSMFHKNVGNLLVTITDYEGETVYETIVNTSSQTQMSIPLSGLPSGVYTITFGNGSGCLYGNFEI